MIRRKYLGVADEGKWTEGTMKRRKARMSDEIAGEEIESPIAFIDEVKRYLSVGKVKRMFTLGTELFSAAQPFLSKPTWWSAGQVAFAVGKVLVEDVEIWADDFFTGDDWVEPYSPDFNQTLLHVLQRFPFERIKTAEDNTFLRVCSLPNGVKVGWSYASKAQIVDHIYVEAERQQEGRDCIKQLLWEQFEGKSLVMRKNEQVSINGDEPRVVFEVDNAFESKLSRRATELSEQLKKPLANNVSRSIMFYGPPGTGKSTLARTIVELMGLRSFRVRIGDLGGLNNATLFEAINIFEPDAVILDDFDRAQGQAQLLETLEFFQQRVKLVITTVNNRRRLDDALMRPGRIDILELVDRMDEEVIKHVLGEFVDGYDIVKAWPIAFITEYVKRRTYMSVEEAAASVKELAQRVGSLKNYRDEDDEGMDRMLKILKRRAMTSSRDENITDVDEDGIPLREDDVAEDPLD